jgi:hypothetical protein
MAQSLAKGVADGGGVLDRQFGAKSASDIQAIFSVLRFEDSLSKEPLPLTRFVGNLVYYRFVTANDWYR